MKSAVALFALIAVAGLVFAGCKTKKPADKQAEAADMSAAMAPDKMAPDEMAPDKMAPDKMAPDKMAPDKMGSMKAGGIADFGIKECDAYIRIWKCYLAKLPVAQQGPTRDVFKKSIDTWRKMASGPAKSSLGMTCKAAYDGWKKAIETQPKFKVCFTK